MKTKLSQLILATLFPGAFNLDVSLGSNLFGFQFADDCVIVI